MDWQRSVLLAAMAAVAFMLFLQWNEFQERKRPPVEVAPTLPSITPITEPPPITTSITTPTADTAIPDIATSGADIPRAPEEKQLPTASQTTNSQLITVKTDTLEMVIDTLGGDIIKVGLPKYYAALDTPDIPFELLNRTKNQVYIAQSGLVGPNGTDSSGERPLFSAQQSHYQMGDEENVLTVDLRLTQGDTNIVKRFTFQRGDYLVKMQYFINNQSDTTWVATLFAQIKRDATQPDVSSGLGMQPFLGAATTTDEENYKKFSFDELDESSFDTSKKGGWVAMVQHYFLSAWIPNQEMLNKFKLHKSQNSGLYILRFTAPRTEITPGSQASITASFYAGPKDTYRLEEISPYLDLTVDYGWLWWIAKPLFQFLKWIYGYLHSWGWSIIILTIVVKAIFFPLSATSYKSMAKMRKVQPMMQDLKERYGDNRQKMSEEVMKLYKKEKVNPLNGCLPILVQMPVFIALYWVLMESVELRHTPFLGWINDLSVKDPFYILPIVMGITMYIQQKLAPAPPDPTQARIMQMMPFVFTFMFMLFPAGLVMYWVVNNTLSIAQQYVITKQIEAAG